jgi:hypothetical protein
VRFIVDADLPRRAAELLRDAGHDAVDVRDIGLGSAHDEDPAGAGGRAVRHAVRPCHRAGRSGTL